MSGWLEVALKVRPGEGRKTFLMFLYSLFLIPAPFIIGRTVSATLFLKRIDPSYLPLVYIGSAFGVGLLSVFYARVANRLRRDYMIMLTLALAVVFVIFFRIAVWRWERAFSVMFLLYVFIEMLGAISIIQFWTFANDLFTSREAKRLFGLIAAGGTVSQVIFGGLVRAVVKKLGAPNLLFLIASLLFICFFIVFSLGRNFSEELDELKHKLERSSRSSQDRFLFADFIQLFKSRHLLTIAGIVALTYATMVIVDYQWMLSARAHYLSEEALAHYFGSFYFFCGIIACVFQFFLTARIMERFGVLAGLLLLPAVLVITSLTIIFTAIPRFFLWLTSGAKGADNVLRYTVYNHSQQVLYLPVASDFRARAKAVIDGMVRPLASALSGLGVFFLAKVLAPRQLAFLILPLLGVWIGLIVQARRHYLRSLADTIRKKSLDLESARIKIDESALRFLENALKSQDEKVVYNALELISSISERDWEPELVELLKSSKAGIRKRALELLARKDEQRLLAYIRPLFSDPDPEVRATAIESYCKIAREKAIDEVVEFLSDPHPEVKSAVITSLIQYGGLDGIIRAVEDLKAMFSHQDWRMRMAGAKVLEKIRVRYFYQPLFQLLDDPVLEVRVSAIKACGAIKSPELVPCLINKLAERGTFLASAKALAEYGEEVLDELAQSLFNKEKPFRLRQKIPFVLSRIESEKSLKILLRALEEDDDEIRFQVLLALEKMQKALFLSREEREKVSHLLMDELKKYFQYELCLFELKEFINGSLVEEELLVQKEKTEDRILLLLSLLYPRQAFSSIRKGLRSKDKSIRANALELIDNIVQTEKKKLILAVFEPISRAEKIRLAREYFSDLKSRSVIEWFEEFIEKGNNWLVACTLYQIGVLKLSELVPQVKRALERKEPVIVESALVSLEMLLDKSQYLDLLKKFENYPAVSLAEWVKKKIAQMEG